MQFDVRSKIVRSRVGFTQGLEFRDGVLYESTGNIGGTTQLNTITLDGKVTTLADRAARCSAKASPSSTTRWCN